MNRAYSLLTVKAVDGDRRLISGVATTPEPDRVGDVIEPLGVNYKNPLPLLLYHDSHKPVGTVKFKKPTKDGIEFEAQIASVDDPGVVRDRVNEAWDSVRAGLIRGVSVGFRDIEHAVMKDGGWRFLQTEVLELSLVAIPANASAVISAIKTYDAPHLAASGLGDESVSRPSAGVPASVVQASKGARPMKTIPDQISSFEATRQAKAAERNGLMATAGDAGLTLDAEQTVKYDALDTEIKDIDAHLVRLRALETETKATAPVVTGVSTQTGTDSRRGAVQVRSTQPPEMSFVRYVICKAVAYLSQGSQSATEVAKERYPDNPEIQLMLKTAVTGATTLDANYAAQLAYAQDSAQAFLNWLRPQTIVGRLQGLTHVPFNVRYGTQTSGGVANWVGQGLPKPLTSFTFSSGTLGITKLAAIAVLADELVRVSSPNAEALVRQSLADAIIQQLDLDFIDPANAGTSNVKPASITNGVTPLTTAGTSGDNAITDLGKLFKPIVEAKLNPTQVALIMPATLGLSLGLLQNSLGQMVFPGMGVEGGVMKGFQVITTQQAAFTSNYGNVVIAVHTPSIYIADDGQVTIDVSREASLEMLDSSLQQSGQTGTGASLVSMFQTNMVAIRAERYINWKRARTAAVQWMSDVNWGSIGSPA